MYQLVSGDISTSVVVKNIIINNNFSKREYGFEYKITIENLSNNIVQLISRKWWIVNAFTDVRYIEGEGVVGEKPILYPFETFEYQSYCYLNTNVGKMMGKYIFLNLENSKTFEVDIATFYLNANEILN